jgi:hypothetical protein
MREEEKVCSNFSIPSVRQELGSDEKVLLLLLLLLVLCHAANSTLKPLSFFSAFIFWLSGFLKLIEMAKEEDAGAEKRNF